MDHEPQHEHRDGSAGDRGDVQAALFARSGDVGVQYDVQQRSGEGRLQQGEPALRGLGEEVLAEEVTEDRRADRDDRHQHCRPGAECARHDPPDADALGDAVQDDRPGGHFVGAVLVAVVDHATIGEEQPVECVVRRHAEQGEP